MALGTLAALVRYRRTGTWPGADGASGGRQDGAGTAGLTTGRLVSLWGRVVVGFAVALYAAISLDASGLL